MNFFDPNNGIFRFLGRIVDLAVLNIVALICCLPIFTIGASVTALNYVAHRMRRGTDGYILRMFWKSFKENFKQSTAIWLIMVAIMGVSVVGLYLMLKSGGTLHSIVAGVVVLSILVIVLILLWVFPLQAKFINPVKATIRNALILSIKHIFVSIYMLMVLLLPMALLVLSWRVFPIVLAFGMSAPAYFSAFAYDKTFQQLEEKILEQQQSSLEEKE